MTPDTFSPEGLDTASAKLEDLLHRYNELTARQIRAMEHGDLRSAGRLARLAEGIISACWKTGRELTSGRSGASLRGRDHTSQKRRLQHLGETAELNTKRLETLLFSQRKRLLKSMGQLESASPEPIAAGTHSGHANLVNITT